MIYNAKKWQSINKTNRESKYLQFCRAKAYYIVQHMFLTEAVLLTLLLYKTPSGYCTSFASQVRVTEWIQPEFKVFIQNFCSLFHYGDNVSCWGHCSLLGTMSLSGDNVPFWGQCPLLGTMSLSGDNVPYF